jgi:hypothetical protein
LDIFVEFIIIPPSVSPVVPVVLVDEDEPEVPVVLDIPVVPVVDVNPVVLNVSVVAVVPEVLVVPVVPVVPEVLEPPVVPTVPVVLVESVDEVVVKRFVGSSVVLIGSGLGASFGFGGRSELVFSIGGSMVAAPASSMKRAEPIIPEAKRPVYKP